MDLLDGTIVNVAAPTIHRTLHTSSTALQWIIGGYPLALAVGLLVGGRLGDLFGRRTDVPHRRERLHARLDALRPGPQHRGADSRAALPGPRRRDDDPAGTGADARGLPARRSEEGLRPVRPGDGLGGDGRPDRGWRADRPARGSRRLAPGVPDQPSRRPRRHGRRGAAAAASRGASRARAGPARCAAGDTRLRVPDLSADSGTFARVAQMELRHDRRELRAVCRLCRASATAQAQPPRPARRAERVRPPRLQRRRTRADAVLRGHGRVDARPDPVHATRRAFQCHPCRSDGYPVLPRHRLHRSGCRRA